MHERVARQVAPPTQTARADSTRRQRERLALLRLVQPKLTVGASHDPLEREADRVADQVAAAVARLSGSALVQPVADVEGHRCGPACVHRHAGHDHGETADPEVGAAGGDLGTTLSAKVRQAAGVGAPLGPAVRRSMEAAFGGVDFSGVRVHADSAVAPRIGASAFTLGQDIHFAPSAYRPNERSGTWLLSHELTHVVQQSGGLNGGQPAIRRHSSKEHFILGALTPVQIRAIADAKEASDSHAALHGGVLDQVSRWFSGKRPPPAPAVSQQVLHTIQQQLAALERWRAVANANGGPTPQEIDKGGTTYNQTWGGQLLTVTCQGGEVPCTIGDMNALPDFFGSFDDLSTVDKSIVFKTFQVIRRETYIYLKDLQAKLQGLTYSYDAKTTPFGGLAGNNISIESAALPDFGNAAADVMATTTMLAGGNGVQGLDASVGADATLGRNACHFPPESWLRWREHHMKARALIAGATSTQDLAQKANNAIAINAFGEHYLQDSYAAGHLINKGFVMAVAMEHVTLATKKIRGWDNTKIGAMQTATAHKAAYKLPGDAHLRATGQADRAAGNVLDDATMRARDPQSALEAAKAEGRARTNAGDNLATARTAAKSKEVEASGINPASMTFEEYRTWLNDFWLQKITNTLHDKYCLKGLMVASPHQANLFKIYGDSNMMRAAEGAEYTAETSQMSRNAINTLVENKRNQLTPPDPNAPVVLPRAVTSPEAIMARFPNRVVDDDGTEMSLAKWATGEPMRKKIKELVEFFTAERWKEGKLTGLVAAASALKDVAPGLSAAHGPF